MTTISIAARPAYVTDPSAAPAWYNSMSSGTWLNFSTSLQSSGVGWAGTHPGGDGGYRRVIGAWGGAILNTVGLYVGGSFVAGNWMVLFGGGHGDYSGNELYAWGPVESATPGFVRLNDPTIPGIEDVERIDGYPVSRHTYDSIIYLPVENKMLCVQAPGYANAGFTYPTCDLFDFDVDPTTTNPWTAAPNATIGGAYMVRGVSGGYNSVTGKAWAIGGGNGTYTHEYTPSTGVMVNRSKDAPSPTGYGYAKGAIDTNNNLLVWVNTSQPYVHNLANPTSTIYQPTTTGIGPSITGPISCEYDVDNARFVVKEGGGKNLYTLTPGANPASGGDSWTWNNITPAGGDTPAATVSSTGIYGRFRLVQTASMKGLLYLATAETPMSFYKF
jgi:hypothetical protein